MPTFSAAADKPFIGLGSNAGARLPTAMIGLRQLAVAAAVVILAGCGGRGHSSGYNDGYAAGKKFEQSLGRSEPSQRRCKQALKSNRNSSSTSGDASDYIAGCLAGWKDAADGSTSS
jgi:hypothetical protein